MAKQLKQVVISIAVTFDESNNPVVNSVGMRTVVEDAGLSGSKGIELSYVSNQTAVDSLVSAAITLAESEWGIE